jgi:hypothetical protein
MALRTAALSSTDDFRPNFDVDCIGDAVRTTDEQTAENTADLVEDRIGRCCVIGAIRLRCDDPVTDTRRPGSRGGYSPRPSKPITAAHTYALCYFCRSHARRWAKPSRKEIRMEQMRELTEVELDAVAGGFLDGSLNFGSFSGNGSNDGNGNGNGSGSGSFISNVAWSEWRRE